MGRTHASSEREAGFTLLEVLVVLVIMGLMSALILPRLQVSDGARMQAVVHTLESDLRLLRSEALLTGTSASISPSAEGYILHPSGRGRIVPSGVAIAVDPAGPGLLPRAGRPIGFFADGSSTGGVFILRKGTAVVRVMVRGFDGSVTHEP